jgi:hypothetical protein
MDINPETIRVDPSEVAEVEFVPFERFREMAIGGSNGLAPVYANECRDLVYFLGDSF